MSLVPEELEGKGRSELVALYYSEASMAEERLKVSMALIAALKSHASINREWLASFERRLLERSPYGDPWYPR